MEGRAKKKKRDNVFLETDDPLQSIPRTTRWRLQNRLQTKDESEVWRKKPKSKKSSSEETVLSSSGLDVHDVPLNESMDEHEVGGVPDLSSDWRSLDVPLPDVPVNEPVDELADGAGLSSDSRSDGTDTWWNQEDDSVWFDAMEEQAPEENDNQTETDNSPIYNGARLTVAESAVLILTFVLRHGLNGECLSDLLTLISLHCATSNLIHKSLYRFKTFFCKLKSPLIFHRYCSGCEFLVKSTDDKCGVCKKDLESTASYFVEIPLIGQLQDFFKRGDFHKNLQHRKSRPSHPDKMSDIYDGELYRKYSEKGGFLDADNNISLMWYTDGVPLFKSSKVSIWPLYLVINELPYSKRFLQENLIFAGLWFGKSKPSMTYFLKPFHDTLKSFFKTGIDVFCAHCSKVLTVHGMLLCGTCDLPAKCMVHNMNQFNGQYGCLSCLQPGKVVNSGKGHTRAYPFIIENISGPARSHEQFVQHGDEALTLNKPVFGVKGPSWLTNICPDIIRGNAIDYMHCVLLGIVRRLLTLWFDPKFSTMPFSLSRLVNVVDNRLINIRPPHFIKRLPRAIKDQCSYWKASECRVWLLYYSVPVLSGIMMCEYYQHYLLLVEAIYIFNLEELSRRDIDHAENLLIKFCGMYSTLYGENHMSANIHQLLHLPETVRQLGPLWVYSCFSLESVNGRLVRLFHGTQNPVNQIAHAISTMLKIPALSDKFVNGTPAHNLYVKLTAVNHHFRVTETICDGSYVIGSKTFSRLDSKYEHSISQCIGYAVGKCYTFERLLLNGTVYHCDNYLTKARNSCTVVYNDQNTRKCGKILFFCKVYPTCYCGNCECRCIAKYVALVQLILLDARSPYVGEDRIRANLKHILTGSLSQTVVAVDVQDIVALGVCIEVISGNLCITLPPNKLEGD